MKIDAHDLIVWRTPLPEVEHAVLPPSNTAPNPALCGERLFASTFSPGAVCCLGRRSGELRWRVPQGGLGHASVLPTREMVYACTARTLTALRVEDGSEAWSFVPVPGDGEYVYSSPVLRDGRLLIGDRRGRIHALDARCGQALWTTKVAEGNVNSTFLISDSVVVAGTNDATAVGVELETGRLAWRASLDGPSGHEVLWHEDAAVALAESVWWLDPREGRVLRRWTPPEASPRFAAVAGDLLVVADSKGGVAGLRQGSVVYRRVDHRFTATVSYSAATGRVYAARMGDFSILEAGTGERRHELTFPPHWLAFTNPSAGDGHLYVLSHDGEVLALCHP